MEFLICFRIDMYCVFVCYNFDHNAPKTIQTLRKYSRYLWNEIDFSRGSQPFRAHVPKTEYSSTLWVFKKSTYIL